MKGKLMLKKIIIILGILTMITFFVHSILSFRYFMGWDEYSFSYNITGVILAGIMTLHFIFGLIKIIQSSKKTSKERFYMRYIAEYSLHNMSGIFSFGFALLHAVFIELNRYYQNQLFNICWLVTDVMMYITIIIHLSISISHLFITFGLIKNSKNLKHVKRTVYILGGAFSAAITYSHFVFSFS